MEIKKQIETKKAKLEKIKKELEKLNTVFNKKREKDILNLVNNFSKNNFEDEHNFIKDLKRIFEASLENLNE